MPLRSAVRHVAVLLGVCLLLSGCAAQGSRMTAVEERMATLEGRTAVLEAGSGPSAATADVAKDDFRESLDVAAVQAALDASGDVEAAVVALELDPAVDLVKATIRPVTGTDDDVAWESAKALAPLFAGLDDYAPALDLDVGDTRCICSTQLMKGIAAQIVDRTVWEGACAG